MFSCLELQCSLNCFFCCKICFTSVFASSLLIIPSMNSKGFLLDGSFQVKVFVQPHYLHNFVQASFNALTEEKVRGRNPSIFLLCFKLTVVKFIISCTAPEMNMPFSHGKRRQGFIISFQKLFSFSCFIIL